jgi:hypothetical protein
VISAYGIREQSTPTSAKHHFSFPDRGFAQNPYNAGEPFASKHELDKVHNLSNCDPSRSSPAQGINGTEL